MIKESVLEATQGSVSLLRRLAGDIKEEDVIGQPVTPEWMEEKAEHEAEVVTPPSFPSIDDLPAREKPTTMEVRKFLNSKHTSSGFTV